MDEDSIEQHSHLMNLVQDELHILRGLEQNNLAHMMNKPDRKVVQFKPLRDKYDVFFLELLRDPYTAVVGRVADKLHVDPGRIRLARHCCTFNRPVKEHIGSQFDCLLDMLLTLDKVCDLLYYDVLDGPLPRNLRTVEIANGGYPNVKQSCIPLRPEHISVEDLLNDKEVVKLTNSNAKLRLVGICENTMCKVFSLEEKIENIPDYFTLRIEEIPKKKELGCGHHVIHVYDITKTDGVLKFHEEEPVKSFSFSIRDDETLAEVKVRLQEKLSENEEFSQWKFGLLRTVGPPVFLEDTDVVSSCFEGKGDLLDHPKNLHEGYHPFKTNVGIVLHLGKS